jgi:CBS domain containing-hemolysin-like protein
MLTLYLCLALGVSFICSLLESVLLSTTLSHAHLLERDGHHSGTLWLKLKSHDAVQPLTAILTLNTIAHTVGALGVGVEVEAAFPGEYTVAVASALLTIAILLLSEILPKTLGAAYWKELAPFAAHTLIWMVRLMRPFIALILVLKKMLPNADTQVITRDELAALADIGEAEGAIAQEEEAVIANLLSLGSRQVREIMTPRVVIASWPLEYTVQQALDVVPETHFSRIPLIGDSIDDVKGFALRKDVLLAATRGEWERPLSDFLQTAPIIRDDQQLDEVFRDLLREQSHLAFVRDEFGGTAGLVTLEDVLETILGEEIVDEHDEVADMRELARQHADDKSGPD